MLLFLLFAKNMVVRKNNYYYFMIHMHNLSFNNSTSLHILFFANPQLSKETQLLISSNFPSGIGRFGKL